MHECCETKGPEIAAGRERYGRVLWGVFAINAVMFFVEFGGGLLAHSTALLADSLDMFGDATVYGVSLYALHKSDRWQTRAALLKGLVMTGFGVVVTVEVMVKMLAGVVPAAAVMSVFGLLALLANTGCAVLLLRFRGGELNMRSTWLCSRNDVIANTGVLVAAAGVAVTQSAWPDILIGILIAAVFFSSGVGVIRDAIRQRVSQTADAA